MRFTALFLFLILTLSCGIVLAQEAPNSSSQPQPKIVTVPLALDHNRIVINADIPLPNGSACMSVPGSTTGIPISMFLAG